MSQALAQIENQAVALTNAAYLSPALSVEEAVARQIYLQDVVGKLLVPAPKPDQYGNVNLQGADYGILPGTKERTLFQNGAEKLALFFGINVSLSQQQAVEDWDKGFFQYRYRAIASHNGKIIGDIERTCHTREEKYAWVWVETAKPTDPAEVERMKAEKIGRARQVFKDKNKVWVWQEKRPNPDPYSLQNTVLAMAEKRAYVAIIKKVLAATGFFSKEIDFENYREELPDMPEDHEPARPAAKPANGKAQPHKAVSPEEQSINNALSMHLQKEKGAKAGQAYFEGVWLTKPLAERKKEAERLGVLGKSEIVDAEFTEPQQPGQRGLLTEIIQDLKAKLSPNSTGQTADQQITCQIAQLCDGKTKLADLDDGDVAGLIEEFGKWIDRLMV